MSLLAEVVVEEWLNRQGYFTIRGAKLGNDEIDILALRVLSNGEIERRHIEVQVSIKPIGYISTLPDKKRAAKRTSEELALGVKLWVEKKYFKSNKKQLFENLGGEWTREFVIHNVRHQQEVDLIRDYGIKILYLKDILDELKSTKTLIKCAAGADLLELMHLI